FEYSDCWVDDARLVTLNALDAAERGATILPRTRCVAAQRLPGKWQITLQDQASGAQRTVFARALVNAAGPWVLDIVNQVSHTQSQRSVRLVKGSHLIVPKFWEGQQAYLVQNTDKRVIFINPYEGDKALIGTTDIPWQGKAEDVSADDSEQQYLIDVVNRYFKVKLRASDVITRFSGVRPLFDDGKGNPSAVTRDYAFDLDNQHDAPLLHVFGGKITTFRKLAEHALQQLAPFFPNMGADWTRSATLPGGEIAHADFDSFLEEIKTRWPWLPQPLRKHYARLYGARMSTLLGTASSLSDLGEHFGGQLYEAEVRYLVQYEWAQQPEDILWRRTKHQLHLSAAQRTAFSQWFEQTFHPAAPLRAHAG
ncbi:MAG: glycerol-3-phosphate dehydrogenase, partial [Pantoea dispersa]